MTPQEWKTIEKSLADLTLQDRLELVTRLMRTIQVDVAMSPEGTREQLETLVRAAEGRRDARHGRLGWPLQSRSRSDSLRGRLVIFVDNGASLRVSSPPGPDRAGASSGSTRRVFGTRGDRSPIRGELLSEGAGQRLCPGIEG